jgi:molecular chaperone GrpE
MQSSPESEPGETTAPARPDEESNGAPSREQVAELERRNEQLDDRYKRALADLDNYRKRFQRDLDRRVGEARQAVVRDWLEALDSVERAERAQPEGHVLEGFRAVLDQMEAILARYGVRRVGAPGEPFDPELHEAISVVDTDRVPDRAIVEVTRSGFVIGDRVLRPAQVVVARNPHREG